MKQRSIIITLVVLFGLITLGSHTGCSSKHTGVSQEASKTTQTEDQERIQISTSNKDAPPYSFRSVVKPANRAVVNLFSAHKEIRTKRIIQQREDTLHLPPQLEKRITQSLGSGFIFDAKGGYLLTNWHVIENAENIIARFQDESTVYATLIGYDPKSDLAVLKIPTTGQEGELAFADNGSIQPGDWVVAIGNPYGLSNTVTVGVVSAIGRHGMNPRGSEDQVDLPLYQDFIQTDASINPGNSGGPLLNTEGKVVGINTAIFDQGYGLGFAIPVELVKQQLPRLLQGGKIKHGWLGLVVDDLPQGLAKELNLTNGALVTGVDSRGPAAKLSIRMGDVILAFDEVPIKSAIELASHASRHGPGDKVKLTIAHGEEKETILLTLGERPLKNKDKKG